MATSHKIQDLSPVKVSRSAWPRNRDVAPYASPYKGKLKRSAVHPAPLSSVGKRYQTLSENPKTRVLVLFVNFQV